MTEDNFFKYIDQLFDEHRAKNNTVVVRVSKEGSAIIGYIEPGYADTQILCTITNMLGFGNKAAQKNQDRFAELLYAYGDKEDPENDLLINVIKGDRDAACKYISQRSSISVDSYEDPYEFIREIEVSFDHPATEQ
ncbi:MAG: hypothetical protein Q4E47_01395 [Candidatus Saccharibacteria bacterium]|nr:hypothetical protein [Candidatus Saccharibacteria bacterium]